MPKIVKVVPEEDYILTIELDNKHKIIYNMKSRLKAVRFAKLADIDRFKSFQVENGNTILWDDLCQITIDEIITMIER